MISSSFGEEGILDLRSSEKKATVYLKNKHQTWLDELSKFIDEISKIFWENKHILEHPEGPHTLYTLLISRNFHDYFTMIILTRLQPYCIDANGQKAKRCKLFFFKQTGVGSSLVLSHIIVRHGNSLRFFFLSKLVSYITLTIKQQTI